MKFAALVASAVAIHQKPQVLNLAQVMEAMGQPESYEFMDIFNWFDRDGSGINRYAKVLMCAAPLRSH